MNRAWPLLLVLVLPLAAQEPAVPEGSIARLKAHLAELAGDAYEGRNAGYPGNDKAAEYIAAHFKKIGLRPAGEKDEKGQATWFQSFKVDERPTRNVLGFVEGSDPALKSEYVIIGAHHDHVGKEGQASQGRMPKLKSDPDDKVWNGADDNGSGTVTVLEIAQSFMEGKLRPKRSILFMTFSGEEWGLLGSKHYVANPLVPLEKTVAMINLDMVGRNGTKPLEVMAIATSAEWPDLVAEAAKGTGVEYKTSTALIQGSDHYSFAVKGI
ncbi:MAG TPA: M20/M25/M40 family metallo-hydrolase, partial [Planctomycetota bacterium]|nr:M20/M25/M40 family metallo-hydrolase [Planctomycetota bacterium]